MRAYAVLSAASLIGFAGAANATDLNPAPEPEAAVLPIFNSATAPAAAWSGFYVGDHVGAAWGSLATSGHGGASSFKNTMDRALGGGQFGYNIQYKSLVYGAEMDLGAMSLGHSRRSPADPQTVSTLGSGYYGDITGRLGYSFKNFLLYGKGGFAFYDGSLSISSGGSEALQSAGLNGWTLGGGVEFALNPAWSVKAEYEYFQFGGGSMQMSNGAGGYDNRLTVQSAKIGFNYHLRNSY
jgi:outer membrane immunogenic protein